MPAELSSELTEALAEVRNSTGKTAQDKVLVAIAALAWPTQTPAPTPTPAPELPPADPPAA